MERWFQTWDRPEYLEWAKAIQEGYLLHIIRKENQNYLVVQAKLIMADSGLPGFEVITQIIHPLKKDAFRQIELWKQQEVLMSS